MNDFEVLKNHLKDDSFCDIVALDFDYDEKGIAILSGEGYVIKIYINGHWSLETGN